MRVLTRWRTVHNLTSEVGTLELSDGVSWYLKTRARPGPASADQPRYLRRFVLTSPGRALLYLHSPATHPTWEVQGSPLGSSAQRAELFARTDSEKPTPWQATLHSRHLNPSFARRMLWASAGGTGAPDTVYETGKAVRGREASSERTRARPTDAYHWRRLVADSAPWFKFFPRDWLSGVRCRSLDPVTRSAYIDLLCCQWINGLAPSGEKRARYLAGLGYDLAELDFDELDDLFPEGQNPRLLTEVEHFQRSRKQQVNAGKRSARMRAARKRGTHTDAEWAELLAKVNGTCPRCNVATNQFQKDHVVPIYQGGSDSIENLQPLCAKCNTSKGPENVDHIKHLRNATGVERALSGRSTKRQDRARVRSQMSDTETPFTVSSLRSETGASADVENLDERRDGNDGRSDNERRQADVL